jgi:cell division protein FtsX
VAQGLGVRSMLATRIELPVPDSYASLNLYADTPHAFSSADVAAAALVTPFVGAAALVELQQTKVDQLTSALDSSRQIGTAIGILMAGRHVHRDEAFELLVQASRNANRKLRDIAADVEFTGDLPAG